MDLSTIQDRWDELLVLIGAIGVACEGAIAALAVLVRALRSLAGFLAGLAVYTGTDADDRLLARIIRGLDAAADRLDRTGRWIPRLRTGVARKPMDPLGTAALGALLVAGIALSACGGSALRYHVSVAESLDAVIESDAALLETRIGDEAREAVETNCPTAPDWDECVVEQASSVADRFDRWAESHNAVAAARDVLVRVLRETEDADPHLRDAYPSLIRLVMQLVDTARAYGAELDVGTLVDWLTKTGG